MNATAEAGGSREGVTGREARGLAGLLRRNRDYAGNVLTDAIVAVSGFASSIMIARGLGPGGRGQLTASLLWPGVFAALGTLGLSHAFAYASGARWASPRRLARIGTAYAAAVGLPLAVTYYLVSPALLHAQFSPVPEAVRWFGCFIPLAILAGLWWELYRGSGDFVTWNAVKLQRSLGYTLWIGAALVLGLASVVSILWSQVAIVAAALVYLGLRLSRISADPVEGPVPGGRILRYGLAVYASSIFYMLNQQADQLLLSLYVPAESLGQYATAVALSGIIVVGSAAVGAVAFSRLARAGGPAGEGRAEARRALILGGVVLVPAGVLLTLLAPVVVRVLYGPLFEPAGRLLRVLAPAAVLLGGGNLLSDLLRGGGRPLLPTYAMVLGVAVTVPALVVFLPRYGMWAAAWVSLAAYGLMMAFQSWGLVITYRRGQRPGTGAS